MVILIIRRRLGTASGLRLGRIGKYNISEVVRGDCFEADSSSVFMYEWKCGHDWIELLRH